MINQNDPSVIDYQEITGITADGDYSVTELAITYDLSDACYTVEKFVDGCSRDHECYSNQFDAERCFSRWAQWTYENYSEEKKDYERYRNS